MDQTANLNFDSLERSLYNSKVLVIGSGQDLDDRKLAKILTIQTDGIIYSDLIKPTATLLIQVEELIF